MSSVNAMPSGRPRRTWSLKLTTKIWSRGLLAPAKTSPAVTTWARFGPILPLSSITRPTVTGTSALENWVIVCLMPFSQTVKFSLARPDMEAPLAFDTPTSRRTNSTSDVILNSPARGGSCANVVDADERTRSRGPKKEYENPRILESQNGDARSGILEFRMGEGDKFGI